MSVESVQTLFAQANLKEAVLFSETVSDTVEHAAELLGCEPCQIAKTMAFLADDRALIIVASGDSKIDNGKFKAAFNTKAKMIPFGEVEAYTGHLPGGVCPFALKEPVPVWLDESLKRFDVVYTGGGDEHHTVRVTLPQLEALSRASGWIDVCKSRTETL